MTNQDIHTAFEVLVKLNGLTKVENTTNIFVNSDGVKFYLDRYGLHTTLQENNILLMKKTTKLHNLYESIVGKVVPKQLLGRATRNNIRRIVSAKDMTDADKLQAILTIVNRVDSIEMQVREQLLAMFNEYKK